MCNIICATYHTSILYVQHKIPLYHSIPLCYMCIRGVCVIIHTYTYVLYTLYVNTYVAYTLYIWGDLYCLCQKKAPKNSTMPPKQEGHKRDTRGTRKAPFKVIRQSVEFF